jgi:hypothetical protein
MTEDEAKTKWCFKRGYVVDADNLGFDPENPTKSIACIGSECMAWRWENDGSQFGRNQDGFCGLAGKP